MSVVGDKEQSMTNQPQRTMDTSKPSIHSYYIPSELSDLHSLYLFLLDEFTDSNPLIAKGPNNNTPLPPQPANT